MDILHWPLLMCFSHSPKCLNINTGIFDTSFTIDDRIDILYHDSYVLAPCHNENVCISYTYTSIIGHDFTEKHILQNRNCILGVIDCVVRFIRLIEIRKSVQVQWELCRRYVASYQHTLFWNHLQRNTKHRLGGRLLLALMAGNRLHWTQLEQMSRQPVMAMAMAMAMVKMMLLDEPHIPWLWGCSPTRNGFYFRPTGSRREEVYRRVSSPP